MSIKLSIIIPHYNDFDLLYKLLSSIDKRTDIEVIIIDDYSSEAVINEIKSYIEKCDWKNIRFFKNDRKKSAGSCRNIGVENSRGEWLIFADADDYFLSDMYNIVSNYFESDSDIIYFTPTSVYIDTDKIAQRHYYAASMVRNYMNAPSKENSLKLRSKFKEPWSKMFNSGFIKKENIKFDDTPIANDVMFSVKSGIFAKKIEASDSKIYCVTKNSHSITSTMDKEKFEVRFSVFLNEVNFLKENLSTADFNSLNIDGKSWIIIGIENRIGFSSVLSIIKRLIKYNIKLISFKNIRIDKCVAFAKYLKETQNHN